MSKISEESTETVEFFSRQIQEIFPLQNSEREEQEHWAQQLGRRYAIRGIADTRGKQCRRLCQGKVMIQEYGNRAAERDQRFHSLDDHP